MRQNKAVELLKSGAGCCVVVKGDEQFCSDGIGVKPLMAFLRRDRHFFAGACVADKIVGKAAAFLLVLGGAAEVYGEVMSDEAILVLEARGIPYEFGKRTAFIKNRTGDGICPLEEAVRDISDPEAAFAALEHKIAELMAAKDKA